MIIQKQTKISIIYEEKACHDISDIKIVNIYGFYTLWVFTHYFYYAISHYAIPVNKKVYEIKNDGIEKKIKIKKSKSKIIVI